MNLVQYIDLVKNIGRWLLLCGFLFSLLISVYSGLKPKIRGRKLPYTEFVTDAVILGISSFIMALGMVLEGIAGAAQEPTISLSHLPQIVFVSLSCLIFLTLLPVLTFVFGMIKYGYVVKRNSNDQE